MLFNKPVTHSLEEELREFKLLQEEGPSASPPQVKEPDEKGGDYAGPPNGVKPDEKGYAVSVGDKAAGDRYNVSVRPDGKFTDPAKAEDETTAAEPVQEAHGKKLPPFLQKKMAHQRAAMENEAVAEAEAARAEVVEKAQQVIESYYAADEQLSAEELQVVIEAYAVVTSAYDSMLEDVTAQLESIVEAGNGNGNGNGDGDEDGDDDDDKDEAKAEKPAKCPPAMESVSPTMTRARRVLAERGGNDLDGIVGELRSLEEALNVESPKAKALDRHAKIVEGFESLGTICDQVVGRIDEILRTEAGVAEGEDYEVSDQDPRVEVASFIAGIAESAEQQLALLAKGQLDDATATENLARCQHDLEQAKEHMKSVAA
jgi:hypothetical protein